jgi:nucleoside-diphosphate-sugar epimerase
VKILIIGCGFVGKALATALKDHELTLTTLSAPHLPDLFNYSSNCFLLNGSDEQKLKKAIEAQDIVIVCLAAKGKSSYEQTYLNTAKVLRKLIGSKHLIYTSSTGVYIEDGLVTEESKTNGILALTEQELFHLPHTTILRLGEIYGKERSLEKKIKNPPIQISPLSPINMIHIDDVVGAILFAIKKPLYGIYNLVQDNHKTRLELYKDLSKKYGVGMPNFQYIQGNTKIVSNEKIKAAGYRFLDVI